LIFYLYYY